MSLVQKMALPREMFPVASMMVSGFHVGPQLVILLVACVASGWSPDAYGLAAGVLGLLISENKRQSDDGKFNRDLKELRV